MDHIADVNLAFAFACDFFCARVSSMFCVSSRDEGFASQLRAGDWSRDRLCIYARAGERG